MAPTAICQADDSRALHSIILHFIEPILSAQGTVYSACLPVTNYIFSILFERTRLGSEY